MSCSMTNDGRTKTNDSMTNDSMTNDSMTNDIMKNVFYSATKAAMGIWGESLPRKGFHSYIPYNAVLYLYATEAGISIFPARGL